MSMPPITIVSAEIAPGTEPWITHAVHNNTRMLYFGINGDTLQQRAEREIGLAALLARGPEHTPSTSLPDEETLRPAVGATALRGIPSCRRIIEALRWDMVLTSVGLIGCTSGEVAGHMEPVHMASKIVREYVLDRESIDELRTFSWALAIARSQAMLAISNRKLEQIVQLLGHNASATDPEYNELTIVVEPDTFFGVEALRDRLIDVRYIGLAENDTEWRNMELFERLKRESRGEVAPEQLDKATLVAVLATVFDPHDTPYVLVRPWGEVPSPSLMDIARVVDSMPHEQVSHILDTVGRRFSDCRKPLDERRFDFGYLGTVLTGMYNDQTRRISKARMEWWDQL